jgi:hypothetical protein
MTADVEARCHCGAVGFEAAGAPIASVVCYCDDCQEAGRRIEALPGARAVRDPEGGSAYLVYRKNRVRCVAGAEYVDELVLRDGSATRRLVARCCSAPLLLSFNDSKHWVDLFAGQVVGATPRVQFRMCTRFSPSPAAIPTDSPTSSGYPFRFILRLLAARLASW